MLLARPSLPLLRCVLCLTLLTSSTGFAQAAEEAPPPVPPPTEEAAPPPLVPAAEQPQQAPPSGELFPRQSKSEEQRKTFLVPRLILQPPAGFALGAMAGVVSIFPTFLLALPFCKGGLIDGFANEACDKATYAGVALGAAFGASLAVTGVGNLMYGRGKYWHTLLGALAGTASGAALGTVADLRDAWFIAILLASQSIGATVAYALSDSSFVPPEDASPQATSSFSVLPVVSTTRAGGLMGGLIGRF